MASVSVTHQFYEKSKIHATMNDQICSPVNSTYPP